LLNRQPTVNILKKFAFVAFSAIELVISFFLRLIYKKDNYELSIIKTDNLGDNIILIRALQNFKLPKLLVITTIEASALYRVLLPEIDLITINRHLFRTNSIYRIKIIRALSSFDTQTLMMPISSVDWLSAGSIFTYIKSQKKLFHARIGQKSIGSELCRLFDYKAETVSVDNQNEVDSIEAILDKNYHRKKKTLKENRALYDKPASEDVLLFPYTTDNARNITKNQLEFIISSLNEQGIIPIILGKTKIPYELEAELKAKDLTNQTSLNDVIHMIPNARCVICAESGPYQIAQLFEINTLLLAGGGHFERFFSADQTEQNFVAHVTDKSCFGCNWSCIHHYSRHFPCLEHIQRADILRGLTQVLGGKNE
jgi:ADP-heptose:LPS heptosyltransferase